MAWIAKTGIKVSRQGKVITLAPGELVPEASTWKKPTKWCNWVPDSDEVEGDKTPDDATSGEGSNPNGSEGEVDVDLETLTNDKLKEMIKESDAEKDIKDRSFKGLKKDDLIAILTGEG